MFVNMVISDKDKILIKDLYQLMDIKRRSERMNFKINGG